MKYYLVVLNLLFIIVSSCDSGSNAKQKIQSEENSEALTMIKYDPVLVSNHLPDIVDEQSGMIWHDSLIWVNNDSGGESELYAYNLRGELKQSVKIENVKNEDWEALAEDEDYFYIGEFGNNYGSRKNLQVFRIEKSGITNDLKIELKADVINFSWADQKDFRTNMHKHNYDCEAFFSYGDSLYFFTKNWENLKTRMYAIQKSVKNKDLNPIGEFNTNFMVTGADINSDGSILALVGYKNYKTYMVLFYEFNGTDFFSGKNVRLDLSSLGGAQTEGVVFSNTGELFISTEATKQSQAVYQIDWKQWIK